MASDDHVTRDLSERAVAAYRNGDIREALSLNGEALARIGEQDDTGVRLSLLVQRAGWLREAGKLPDAAVTLQDAAGELAKFPLRGHEWARSLLLMEQGVAALERGDTKQAEAILREAEVLARQDEASGSALTAILSNRARLYLDIGRFSEARDVLQEALEVDRQIGDARGQSNDLNMLGLVHRHLGDLETAEAYLRNAAELAYENGLARETLHAMNNLATLMDLAGQHAEAAELQREIGSFYAQGGDDAGVACSVANQGAAAALAGDLDRAEMLFTRSHELHLSTGNLLHAIHDQINLSSVAVRRGDPARALAHAQRALASAREHGQIEVLWTAEYMLATSLADLASGAGEHGRDSMRPKKRWQAYVDALAGFRRAADIVELLRTKIDRPEERETLLADKEMIYERAVALCCGFGRASEAFQFSERARMRAFLEALGSSRLQRLEIPDPATDRRGELVTQLLSPLTPADEKPRVLDELRILRAERAARQPVIAAITEAQLPTEEDIRAAIPAETCLLEYFQIGSTIVMFLLDQAGLKDCQLVKLAEPIDSLVQRFRDEIDNGDSGMDTGNTLFAALFRPVMPHLATTAKLIVVPHRTLHYVPFSALWFEPAGDDAPPREYLKSRFELTMIPSASYLPYLARTVQQKPELGPAVVLGNPTGDLAGADREAREVAARLGVTARLGPEATRDAFLGAGAPAVLHVACHGVYNATDPLLSGLKLADGDVTVEDMLNSGPAPGLLVLSGCLTGMSQRRPGDELIGLAQAALRAGTSAVVATLWETFDESSAVFFEHFYDALADGSTVSYAVALGRHALSADPGGYEHPVDWAPFLLIGDPQHDVGPAQSPMATFRRGMQLWKQDDLEGAKAAFQRVINGGATEVAALAGFSLGTLLRYGQEDLDGARTAWQGVIESGDPAVGPRAVHALGSLLEEEGDFEGALAAYRQAHASGHPEAGPAAAIDLGNLLAQQGHTEEARAIYQNAIDTGNPESAAMAAYNLGSLLLQQGDTDAAREALQAAIDTGHPDVAPHAAYELGVLLAGQGYLDDALAPFQIAAQSTDTDEGREAAAWIARQQRRHSNWRRRRG